MADAVDKTEAATPRRRAEARRRGQVTRSADLVSAAVLLTALALMQITGPALVAGLQTFVAQSLRAPATPVTWPGVIAVSALLGRAAAPLLAGVVAVAIVANLLQFGFVFRFPRNEDALDLGKGIERLCSPKSRVRVVIDLVKLVAVAWLGYSLVQQCADRIVALQQLDAGPSMAAGMAIVFGITLRIGVLLLTLGVLDYAYQRWQHERDLRMTRREVKDELRQMEGDPATKRTRRLFSNSLVSSRQERSVALAKVLVTHENQLAVAIQYDSHAMRAPRVVAKGIGGSVAGLRNAAASAGVAIVEQEPLARTLAKLIDVGGEVPHSLYSAVAEVLAYAAAARQGGEQ